MSNNEYYHPAQPHHVQPQYVQQQGGYGGLQYPSETYPGSLQGNQYSQSGPPPMHYTTQNGYQQGGYQGQQTGPPRPEKGRSSGAGKGCLASCLAFLCFCCVVEECCDACADCADCAEGCC